MQFTSVISAHPIEVILACGFALGAVGDVGRLLQPKHPTLAGVLAVFSSTGLSILGIARGVAVMLGKGDPSASNAAPSTPTLPSVPPPPTLPTGERGAAMPETLVVIVAAAAVGIGANLLLGCGAVPPTIEAAAYGAKLADCEARSATCASYVACRDAVQVAEGRGHYRGHCADEDAGALDSGPSDAGLEAGGDQ